MPTVPLHQGCAREPGDHLDGVGLLLRHIFVRAAARRNRRSRACRRERPHSRRPAKAGMRIASSRAMPVAAAVGEIFEDRRHRPALSAGSQSRAASRQPSASAIQTVSSTRGGRRQCHWAAVPAASVEHCGAVPTSRSINSVA